MDVPNFSNRFTLVRSHQSPMRPAGKTTRILIVVERRGLIVSSLRDWEAQHSVPPSACSEYVSTSRAGATTELSARLLLDDFAPSVRRRVSTTL